MTNAISSEWQFHHLGYASQSIESEVRHFEFLGYRIEGQPFSDPAQGISGCFMTGAGPRIELLENLPGSDTLTPWLKAGIKIYHTAYVVPDINTALETVAQQRARIVTEPIPAVAFNNRQIAFAMLRNKLLVEFIQK